MYQQNETTISNEITPDLTPSNERWTPRTKEVDAQTNTWCRVAIGATHVDIAH